MLFDADVKINKPCLLPSSVAPERGCVRSTSRSWPRLPDTLRLGIRPQPRSGECALALLIIAIVSQSLAAESRLTDAAEKSDRTAIRALLKQHADVNAPQVDGMTALHWAAYLDDLETARLLLDSRADVNATNRYGVTPLSLACVNGNPEFVESLLAA